MPQMLRRVAVVQKAHMHPMGIAQGDSKSSMVTVSSDSLAVGSKLQAKVQHRMENLPLLTLIMMAKSRLKMRTRYQAA